MNAYDDYGVRYDRLERRIDFPHAPEPDLTGRFTYFSNDPQKGWMRKDGKMDFLKILKDVTKYEIGVAPGENDVLHSLPPIKVSVYDFDLNRIVEETGDNIQNTLTYLIQHLFALHEIVTFKMARTLHECNFPKMEFEIAKDQYWYQSSADLFKVVEVSLPTGKCKIIREGETRIREIDESQMQESYHYAPNIYNLRHYIKDKALDVRMLYSTPDQMAEIWLEQEGYKTN